MSTNILSQNDIYLNVIFLPKGAPKVKNLSGSKTKDKEMTESAKVNENKPENAERLGRQQWKNKMKNKRKCKNKYRQNKPEEEVKTESYSNNNNNNSEKLSQTSAKREGKECKPQKRKKTVEDTEISRPTKTQTLREEKQIPKEKKTKDGEVGKGATVSSADGSEQKAVEIADGQHQLPMKRPKPELSKKQSLNREKLWKMLHSQETDRQESPAETKDEPAVPEEKVPQDRSASLRSRMEQRLESARFRYINEVLYSTSSSEAKRMFKQDPQAFWIYHRGYTTQVQRWPTNPVDEIISYIQRK